MSVRIKLVYSPGDDPDEDLFELLDSMDDDAFGTKFLKTACYCWIAYDGRLPVGFCCLQPGPDHQWAFLSRVAVVESHRGMGLQRRFIRACERKARACGFPEVVTYVAHWNVVSVNNFIRCGYSLYEPAYEYGVPFSLYLRKPMKLRKAG